MHFMTQVVKIKAILSPQDSYILINCFSGGPGGQNTFYLAYTHVN